MPEKKSGNQPIVITFTIDPAMKLNTNAERYMAVSVVARHGEVGQVSRFEMTNWKTDLPTEVDRLMKLLLGGSLILPDFPDMNQAVVAAPEAVKPDDASEEVEEVSSADNDMQAIEAAELVPEEPAADEGEYDITIYPTAVEPGEDASSQASLF